MLFISVCTMGEECTIAIAPPVDGFPLVPVCLIARLSTLRYHTPPVSYVLPLTAAICGSATFIITTTTQPLPRLFTTTQVAQVSLFSSPTNHRLTPLAGNGHLRMAIHLPVMGRTLWLPFLGMGYTLLH